MTRHLSFSVTFVAFLLAAIPAAAAEKKVEPLTIQLSASFAPAESDVLVRMRVAPDPRARELTLEWVSTDLSGGSHAVALEGARAPLTHSYSIKRVPEGEYLITAILRFDDGSEVRRVATVAVVGMGATARPSDGPARGSSGRKWPASR